MTLNNVIAIIMNLNRINYDIKQNVKLMILHTHTYTLKNILINKKIHKY